MEPIVEVKHEIETQVEQVQVEANVIVNEWTSRIDNGMIQMPDQEEVFEIVKPIVHPVVNIQEEREGNYELKWEEPIVFIPIIEK